MGHFLYAAKAFDVLERLDPDPEYWEGKRGACVGVFQQVRSTMFFEWITQEENVFFLLVEHRRAFTKCTRRMKAKATGGKREHGNM